MTELEILKECEYVMSIVWKLVREHPEFKYSINDQLIRSCLSIGSNIAEGCERKGKDRLQMLNIALGNLAEARFQLKVYPEFDFETIENKLDKIKAVTIRLRGHDRIRFVP